MCENSPNDAELIGRLQAEFRQPVPSDVVDTHLRQIQTITAGQALRVRNRYWASLAVAAAAVALLAVQLSASVFSPPSEAELAATPTPTSEQAPLVARVDPDAAEAEGETRQLVGRPSIQGDANGESDQPEASVAVLDSVSDSDSDIESDSDADDAAARHQSETVTEPSTTTAPESSTSSTSSSDDAGRTTTSLAPTTTSTPSDVTSLTTVVSTTDECENPNRPGNGNRGARQASVSSPTTVTSFPGQSNPAECKNDINRANSPRGIVNGQAQGLQPE